MKACSESYPNMHISLRLNKYDMRYLRFLAIFFKFMTSSITCNLKIFRDGPSWNINLKRLYCWNPKKKLRLGNLLVFYRYFPVYDGKRRNLKTELSENGVF